MTNRSSNMCCARYDVVRAKRLNDDAHCSAYDMALHVCVFMMMMRHTLHMSIGVRCVVMATYSN